MVIDGTSMAGIGGISNGFLVIKQKGFCFGKKGHWTKNQ